MSTVRASNIYDKDGTSNAVLYGVAAPTGSMGFRNRILNGDCRIDQRNAGASVSGTSAVYTLDRWTVQNNSGAARFNVQQNVNSITPPAGFKNYLGITSTAAYSVAAGDVIGIQQFIEGYNIADLAWGTASAATVTLSFCVRSSLTGTFGGSLVEGATGGAFYPFSYTISAANTWEQKTVTIAGPTIGTWNSTNGRGIQVLFSMGVGSTYTGSAGSWTASNFYAPTGATSVVGTNGATFYITGVQLEAGSVASPFERRDYGRELMMCQRYLPAIATTATGSIATGYSYTSTQAVFTIHFPVVARTQPTGVTVSGSYAALRGDAASTSVSSIAFSNGGSSSSCEVVATISATNFTAGQGAHLRASGAASILFTGCEL